MRDEFNHVLTWVLALLLLVSVLGAVSLAVTPQETADPDTEFYVLGAERSANDYPTNLSVNQTGRLIVGITNYEHEMTTYTVLLLLNDRPVGERTTTVADERTWEGTFSFRPTSPGRERLDVLLYKGENADSDAPAYRRLRLFINVSG